MKEFDQIITILPEQIKNKLNELQVEKKNKAEEIRFRINRPVLLNLRDDEIFIDQICRHKEIQNIIQILSKNSLYAFQEELKQGYITIPGGHRVGIVGEVMVENDKILNQKNISGLNFRISREIIGVGNKIAPIIFNSKRESIENTLIVSPPGAGKTTLLRDLSRIFSDGEKDILPCKVSLVDERSEIAGSYLGVPQKNVGIRTDVLDACPKALGIILVIRSMSPDLVVTDEIGKDEDIKAINEAVNAGVKVLVSAHSDSLNSLINRKGFRELLETGGIKNVILLSRKKGPGTIESTISGKEFLNKNKI